MGTFSTPAKNDMLDAILGSSSPATVYVAAYVAGTEVSGSAYARVAVTNNATNFPAAASGAKANGAAIEFPEATGSWGTLDEIRVQRHITNNEPLAQATISKAIDTGDVLRFKIGDLEFQLTDPV